MLEKKSSMEQKRLDAKEFVEALSKLTEEQKKTIMVMIEGYELLRSPKRQLA